MEVSKLSSHLGSSDGDSENDLQQRMEDFQDLPEGPILINGKLKKTLQKISQRLQKIDNIKEKTKLDDEKVYEVLGKTLQTFFSIDATEYINETKQFMALSRFFFSEINRKIVVPEEEQQKQEQPRRQDIESRPAKNESKQNIIEHAFKQEEVIPKTVKKERVRQASRQNGNDPTMTTQINGERRQEQQWSQILNPTMFSNDEPSRIEARISNMSHPITWQRKAHFEVAGRKITKLHNDDYRKICADRPLTGFDNYRFKFRVEKLGTIAIGLVPERWKQGPFIDDRSITTFKFIGFANGNGGLIKYNLDQLMKGRQLAIKKGDIVELKVNLKEMKVHLKTHIQAESMEIDIRALKDYKLHLYVEMKQKDTCIEFIE